MMKSARYALLRIGIWVIIAAIFSGGFMSLPAQASRAANTDVIYVASIPVSSSTVGIADSDIFFMSQADVNKTLDAMLALGVTNVRVQIPWAAVEGTKGSYDWSAVDKVVNAAASRNMGILGVLNTTPTWAAAPGGTYPSGTPQNPAQFASFAAAAAARYQGKVSAYEIWNEPNASMFYSPTPNAAGYVAILKASYTAIKAADPTATVIGGVIASVPYTSGTTATNSVDFVAQMYAAGAAGYFDALSYHPYQYGLAFSAGMPVENSPINQVQAMRDLMIAYGDAAKLIWATEYGAPVSATNEAMQAALISDFLNTWSTVPYAGPVFVYTTRDKQTGSTHTEDTFGLLRTNWTLKAAATVVKNFIAGARTAPYGSWPVIVLTDLYDQWAAQYGEALALQAMANVYQQAVVDHGQITADIYFNAVRMVITSALSAPAGTVTSATSVAIEAVKADIAAQTAATAPSVDATVDSVTAPATLEASRPVGAEAATSTVESTTEAAPATGVDTEPTTESVNDQAPPVTAIEPAVVPTPASDATTPAVGPVTATQPDVPAKTDTEPAPQGPTAAGGEGGTPQESTGTAADQKPAESPKPDTPGRLHPRQKLRDALASLQAKIAARVTEARAATESTSTGAAEPSEPETAAAVASESPSTSDAGESG